MKLRVATLNVWALPSPLAKDVPQRVRAIGERLAALDVDVVAFQEVFLSDARDVLVEAGRRAGLVNSWHDASALMGGGLLTLSRLPIDDAQFESYSMRGQAEEIQTGEYLSGKGFSRLQLRTSGGPVSFINTHLHARYKGSFEHEFKAYRTAQVVQLASAAARTKHPVIVAGDFNFGEEQREYAVFEGLTGLRDAAAELDRRIPTVYAANPYRTIEQNSKRIDFVFRRNGRSCGVSPIHSERIFDESIPMRGGRGACSNHAGILTEFEIQPASEMPLPSPLAWAVGEASRLIAEGRVAAEQRRREMRAFSCAGLASVLAAGAGGRSPKLSRRRLLRLSLQGAALAAAAPTLGCSMLSEVFVPTEIQAFADAEARLAKLADELGLPRT